MPMFNWFKNAEYFSVFLYQKKDLYLIKKLLTIYPVLNVYWLYIILEGRVNLEVKLAQIQDAPLIHKLMIQAFTEYENKEGSSTALDETIQSVARDLENGEQALISYIDDTPIGMVRFTLTEDALYFTRLSVMPEHQGKGAGKGMLRALENYAMTHDKKKLICKSRFSIEKNMNLYRSAGFDVHEESIFNSHGVDVKVALMVKEFSLELVSMEA